MIECAAPRLPHPPPDHRTSAEQDRDAVTAWAIKRLGELKAQVEEIAKEVDEAYGDSVAFVYAEDGIGETISILEAGLNV